MKVRHFLRLNDCSPGELQNLLARAAQLKADAGRGKHSTALAGRTLAMLFEQASTRTRVAFEVATLQLGGHAIFLSSRDTQLGRGESLADTARVLSRMVDALLLRVRSHDDLLRFAEYSRVPVINGLSDAFHPCQVLADMLTYREHRGDICGRLVAWLGDGSNVCQSYINASRQFDFRLHLACPPGYRPVAELLQDHSDRVRVFEDPVAAVRGADLVVTDAWVSMGREEDRERRRLELRPYQVSAALMAQADPRALFMHCLPAYRGEEVVAEVFDGPQSVVWDEAGNRLHTQKALLEFLFDGQR